MPNSPKEEKKKSGKLIHTRGWQGAPGPIYCANEKPCYLHDVPKEERKIICPGCSECTESMPNGELCEKLRECECHYSSSPTWEAQEREAWKENASLHSSMIGQLSEYELNKIANYWLERMKALRQEAYDEGAAEATMVCNEKTVPMAIEEKHSVDALYGYDAGRFAALEEAKEMIEKDLPMAWFPGGALHLKQSFLKNILSSLQQLKDRK